MLNLEKELNQLRERLDKIERNRSRPGSAWLNETNGCRHMGRGDGYLRALRLEGRGPPATKVGRQWMYRVSDLDNYMADLAKQQETAA